MSNDTAIPSAAMNRPEPFSLVIFGASGDLTARKLLPAVYGLFTDGLLPREFRVVGYARTPQGDEPFRDAMREAVGRSPRGKDVSPEAWRDFAARLHYVSGDYTDASGFHSLAARLRGLDAAAGTPGNCLFYLATPPNVFVPIVTALRAAGLARPGARAAPWSRLIVEKPFGRDLAGARALNAEVLGAFAERQVFRIDHYLGKETVQNLLVLRFANSIFEPIWNQKYIDHVQITVAETVGVERRGSYYEHAGALRDIVQNHLMHLVCLVAMEPPLSLEAEAVRDEKVKVVRSLRPLDAACMPGGLVRAQYGPGTVQGKAVPGYREEPEVAPDSLTETYAAIKTSIDNWRWAGVPFYLRTGKRLPARATEIAIQFKAIPRVLFGAPPRGPVEPNVLVIRIQPNEGISMRFQVKVPGHAMRIEPYQMDFGYAETFRRGPPEAYERLLLDAVLGDATLFTRGDEIEAAWTFLEPVLEACRPPHVRELPTYPAGTWGPRQADALIQADGRRWMLTRPPADPAAATRGENPCAQD
jgi:glucose-6-phosphate 1-dehydrogenase